MLDILFNSTNVDPNTVIWHRWNASSPPFVSGLDIRCKIIHAICPGQVIAIERSPDGFYAITVQVNSDQCTRYCNLSSCSVSLSQQVKLLTKIGGANRYMRIEYCTSNPLGFDKWPVRIGKYTYYKQDPSGLLDGSIKLAVYTDVTIVPGDQYTQLTVLDKYQAEEFNDGRGDRVVEF